MAEEDDFIFEEDEEEGIEETQKDEEGEELEELTEEPPQRVIIRPKFVPAKVNITRPIMTKNEMAKILSERVKQLEQNAPTTLTDEELDNIDDVIRIAALELALGKSPMVLDRYLPNGTYEVWNVNELELPDIPLL